MESANPEIYNIAAKSATVYEICHMLAIDTVFDCKPWNEVQVAVSPEGCKELDCLPYEFANSCISAGQ